MWSEQRYVSEIELFHYGVKGMKWGVRRSRKELALARQALEKEKTDAIMKVVNRNHKSNPKQSTPNSIMDHVNDNGKIDARSYYDSNGMKVRDIHTTNHGNPKRHPYGQYGEHAHDYTWNEIGELIDKVDRELTKNERKENADIL